jgi:hypothetical protein
MTLRREDRSKRSTSGAAGQREDYRWCDGSDRDVVVLEHAQERLQVEAGCTPGDHRRAAGERVAQDGGAVEVREWHHETDHVGHVHVNRASGGERLEEGGGAAIRVNRELGQAGRSAGWKQQRDVVRVAFGDGTRRHVNEVAEAVVQAVERGRAAGCV